MPAPPAPEPLPLRTLLRREESYAVHALVNIGENPGTSAAAVARQLQLPRAYTAKVLRRLVEAGWVESRMGRAGGVWLRVDPAELTLLEVMEGVSGPLRLDPCLAQARCVTQRRRGRCRLNHAYARADAAIRAALAEVRLSELIDPDGSTPTDRSGPTDPG